MMLILSQLHSDSFRSPLEGPLIVCCYQGQTCCSIFGQIATRLMQLYSAFLSKSKKWEIVHTKFWQVNGKSRLASLKRDLENSTVDMGKRDFLVQKDVWNLKRQLTDF